MGLGLKAGSVVRLQSSGGGGLGDAAERDVELVESDRRLGYASA